MCFTAAFAYSLRPSHISLTQWRQKDLLMREDANKRQQWGSGKTLPVREYRDTLTKDLFIPDITIHIILRWPNHKWANETSVFTSGCLFAYLGFKGGSLILWFLMLVYRCMLIKGITNYCFQKCNTFWSEFQMNAWHDLCCCMLIFVKPEKFCESLWMYAN